MSRLQHMYVYDQIIGRHRYFTAVAVRFESLRRSGWAAFDQWNDLIPEEDARILFPDTPDPYNPSLVQSYIG